MRLSLAVCCLAIVTECIAGEIDPTNAEAPAGVHAVQCDGTYPHHLQGICTNERDAIYWSFTDILVKTDQQGRVSKKIPVANHHGDLCFHDGKIYVAVNLGQFNDAAGKADVLWWHTPTRKGDFEGLTRNAAARQTRRAVLPDTVGILA
jgi:hypothetical protein